MGGHAEVVSLLLEKGADIEAKAEVRASLMNMLGFVALTQLLTVVYLALPSSSYYPLLQDGRTPLHHAAMKGHAEVVSLLLEKGADIQARDEVRASPIIMGFMALSYQLLLLMTCLLLRTTITVWTDTISLCHNERSCRDCVSTT